MSGVSGTLITRNYSNFRGVDYTNEEVSLNRSPDSLNMWKDYKNLAKCIETRPSLELLEQSDNTIFGLYFFKVGNSIIEVIHSGTKLYKKVNGVNTEIFSGMLPRKSQFFVFNNMLYIKDGLNYLKFDGVNCSEVIGYVPTTSIGRNPSGGGTQYQEVNLLSDYRINEFNGDGKSTIYHLDTDSFDNERPTVWVNGILLNNEDYTYSSIGGTVTFINAPSEPLTPGQDNVSIRYKKTVNGYKERIKKCTLLQVFDERVFFSGNQDYPNVVWVMSKDNPSYVSDVDYYNEGLDLTPVKAMVSGNNALWVFKEQSQNNTSIFYHNPVIDGERGKVYPSTHSNISTGCVSTGINFNDDIVFFSSRGMEGISGDITTEQVLAHRSSLIDSKLLKETNYKNMILEEWEGYLLIIIDNKVYLADSRGIFNNANHLEYEYFYWELSKNITCTRVYNDTLYLGCEDGIYTLTDKTSDLESYWCTPKDEFNYPQYQKTTNKRGCVIDLEGNVSVSSKIDNNDFALIGDYSNTQGYVVCRIKQKKWKAIQLKFSSNTRFGLYSSTLESFVGGYIKR